MANLKEVRNRITSVTSTMQITSAMKMVSAAKLRRAQDAIVQMRPYANKLKDILSNLSSSIDSSEGGSFTTQRELGNVLIVMITSNRGLAGAFNTNVIKATNSLIARKYGNQFKAGKVKFMSVGKKASDYVNRNKYPLYSSENAVYDSLNFESVSAIAQKIMDAYSSKEFDRVELVYNAFRNAAVQIPTVEQYLPVLPPEQSESKAKKSIDYIFAPSKEEIIAELIPKSLKIQIYKAVLDSHAAEHGARMTAMNKATDNARDLIKELKLSYNKARQAAITNEILEIVGGAEALEG
ncbi:MAG: ATP synthase F1 subunit gamma [Bacteroidia bacterium]